MANPFVAEIRMFAGNFAPTGWALCNGQILPISQNTALFSLLGTTYGGNGQSTFALPDLQGCAPMHPGQGPGLSLRDLGEQGGTEFLTLLQSEMPIHTHSLKASSEIGEDRTVTDESIAQSTGGALYAAPNNLTQMAPQTLPPAGGSLPHNNMMPYLTVTFIIALQGVFPPRN